MFNLMKNKIKNKFFFDKYLIEKEIRHKLKSKEKSDILNKKIYTWRLGNEEKKELFERVSKNFGIELNTPNYLGSTGTISEILESIYIHIIEKGLLVMGVDNERAFRVLKNLAEFKWFYLFVLENDIYQKDFLDEQMKIYGEKLAPLCYAFKKHPRFEVMKEKMRKNPEERLGNYYWFVDKYIEPNYSCMNFANSLDLYKSIEDEKEYSEELYIKLMSGILLCERDKEYKRYVEFYSMVGIFAFDKLSEKVVKNEKEVNISLLKGAFFHSLKTVCDKGIILNKECKLCKLIEKCINFSKERKMIFEEVKVELKDVVEVYNYEGIAGFNSLEIQIKDKVREFYNLILAV